MPSLEDARKVFTPKTSVKSKKKTTSIYDGDLAKDVYDSLPSVARDVLAIPGAVLAGGYIRDFINGTKPSDIDVWMVAKTEEEVKQVIGMAKPNISKAGYAMTSSHWAYTFEKSLELNIQIMKTPKESPQALVEKFDFTCCKFAVWMSGVTDLDEYHDPLAIEEAREKRLTFCGIEDPSSVLVHISKLHRKGYYIREETLFHILEMYEKGKDVCYEPTKDKRDRNRHGPTC